MKFVCKLKDLTDAINTVQKAVPSKTTMPILDGILIEINENIILTANNLEIGIDYIIPGNILEKGSIIINSKLFGEIVRKLPDTDIYIEQTNDKIIIDALKCHFELPAIPSEGFPKIPQLQEEISYSINQKTFREMVRGTIFSVGTDDSKKNLTGSLVELKDKTLVVVGIDGYRMAIRRNICDTIQNEFTVLVPRNAMSEISKILMEDDSIINIQVSKSLISFKFGTCTFVSRLLECEYINYRNVIQTTHETQIRINTREFLHSLERAYLISLEDKKYPVKFKITEDRLIISSTAVAGHVREEVPVEIIGKGMEIGFNPRYFMDALRAIEDEYINIFLNSSVGPAILKPVQGDNFLYLVLPVKLSPENYEDDEYTNNDNTGENN